MRAYFSLRPYGGRREEQSATFLRHRCGRDLACLPPAKRYTEEAMAAQEATEFVAFSNARMSITSFRKKTCVKSSWREFLASK